MLERGRSASRDDLPWTGTIGQRGVRLTTVRLGYGYGRDVDGELWNFYFGRLAGARDWGGPLKRGGAR